MVIFCPLEKSLNTFTMSVVLASAYETVVEALEEAEPVITARVSFVSHFISGAPVEVASLMRMSSAAVIWEAAVELTVIAEIAVTPSPTLNVSFAAAEICGGTAVGVADA